MENNQAMFEQVFKNIKKKTVMQKDNNKNQEDTPEILIVDDCLFNVAALKSLIMMFDYECDNCSDG